MRRQFRLQPLGTDPWGVLISCPVRNKRLVGDIQREFAFLAIPPHVERIRAGERFGLEPHILHNERNRRHLAPPGTNTFPDNVGACLIAFTRFTRRRFGGVPSAGSTTIRLVTKIFVPCASKSIVVRSEAVSVMTPQPYWKCLMYWPAVIVDKNPPQDKCEVFCPLPRRGDSAESARPAENLATPGSSIKPSSCGVRDRRLARRRDHHHRRRHHIHRGHHHRRRDFRRHRCHHGLPADALRSPATRDLLLPSR
jgi:hypothetical protein